MNCVNFDMDISYHYPIILAFVGAVGVTCDASRLFEHCVLGLFTDSQKVE